MKRLNNTSAFTLIELLTVIAIIGILAAIIIPVVGTVRENAASATTLSNLRQLHLGTRLYANEHRGLAPTVYNTAGDRSWAQMLVLGGYLGGSVANDAGLAHNYYSQTFQNPLVKRKEPTETPSGSFGMNAFNYLTIATNLDALARPSRTVLFADGSISENSGDVDWALADNISGGLTRYPNTLSNGSAHYAFVDGSTRKIRALNPQSRNSPPQGFNVDVFFKE